MHQGIFSAIQAASYAAFIQQIHAAQEYRGITQRLNASRPTTANRQPSTADH